MNNLNTLLIKTMKLFKNQENIIKVNDRENYYLYNTGKEIKPNHNFGLLCAQKDKGEVY